MDFLRKLSRINELTDAPYFLLNEKRGSTFPFSLAIQYKLLNETHIAEVSGHFYGYSSETKQIIFAGFPTGINETFQMQQVVSRGNSDLIYLGKGNQIGRISCFYSMITDELYDEKEDDINGAISVAHMDKNKLEKYVLYYIKKNTTTPPLFQRQYKAGYFESKNLLVMLIDLDTSSRLSEQIYRYLDKLDIPLLGERLKTGGSGLLDVKIHSVSVKDLDQNTLQVERIPVCSKIQEKEFIPDESPRAYKLLEELISLCHTQLEALKPEDKTGKEVESKILRAGKKVLNTYLGENSMIEISTYHRYAHLLMLTDYESKNTAAGWSGPELQQTRDTMQIGNLIYVDDATDEKSIREAHAYFYNYRGYGQNDIERDVEAKIRALLYYNQKHPGRMTKSYVNCPLRCFGASIGHIHATNVTPRDIIFIYSVSRILERSYMSSKPIQIPGIKDRLVIAGVSFSGVRLATNRKALNFLEKGAELKCRFSSAHFNNDSFNAEICLVSKKNLPYQVNQIVLDFSWTLPQPGEVLINKLYAV